MPKSKRLGSPARLSAIWKAACIAACVRCSTSAVSLKTRSTHSLLPHVTAFSSKPRCGTLCISRTTRTMNSLWLPNKTMPRSHGSRSDAETHIRSPSNRSSMLAPTPSASMPPSSREQWKWSTVVSIHALSVLR